ncbi:hypothetical protein D3C79_979580 [compost metagenome]
MMRVSTFIWTMSIVLSPRRWPAFLGLRMIRLLRVLSPRWIGVSRVISFCSMVLVPVVDVVRVAVCRPLGCWVG